MLKNNVFSSMLFGFFALFVKRLDKIKNGGGKLGLYRKRQITRRAWEHEK